MAFKALTPEEHAREIAMMDTSDWFNTDQLGIIPMIDLPEADEDYIYAATRLLSWFPVVNDRGATYEPDDFDEELLNTLIGKQANLEHDKTRVIGSISAYNKNADGIDVAVRIDRTQAQLQGLDPEDMRQGNYFSMTSLELTRDDINSMFYALDDDNTVLRRFTAQSAAESGIRRTRVSDPYRLQGKYRVAERIKPRRFTGIGFLPRGSDPTAKVYAVTASSEATETPLNAPPQIEDAILISEETAMSDADKQALDAKVADLENQVRELTAQRETAAAEAAKVTGLQAQIDELKATLAAKETELASAVTERDTLKSEKEQAATDARISEIVAELEGILASEDDAAKTALREKAASLVNDETGLMIARLERKNAALEAKVKAKETASSAEDTEKKTEVAGSEEFNANVPGVKVGPGYVPPSASKLTTEDLLAAW